MQCRGQVVPPLDPHQPGLLPSTSLSLSFSLSFSFSFYTLPSSFTFPLLSLPFPSPSPSFRFFLAFSPRFSALRYLSITVPSDQRTTLSSHLLISSPPPTSPCSPCSRIPLSQFVRIGSYRSSRCIETESNHRF